MNNNTIYKKETTGSLMKNRFITIDETKSIEQAIDHVRKNAKGNNNIHYLYIVDDTNLLQGVLSIRELLSAFGNQPVSEIMKTNITSFPTDLDQEEATEVFRDTDLVTIPVINQQMQLVGVIHVEDILDVMQQEATEDFHRMASVSTSSSKAGEGLLTTSIGVLYRKRIVWLVVLVFMNVFSGAGIAHYEDIIEANIALVFFLPLLVDSGGNAGAQSSTLVIRAMAIGDVRIKDWFKMFTKEISVAALMGFTMAAAVSTIGLVRGGVDIAIVVSLTMVLIVVIGSVIGMSLPFIFRMLNLDPATASAPLITSICDIAGVLIYFGIAASFLSL